MRYCKSVNHEILLRKLDLYGLKGVTLHWFKSYLSDRHQKSFVNMKLSNEAIVKCGVPQGSILDPLLFLTFINDLPNCLVNSKADLYADDTQVYTASHNISELEIKLNKDLAEIEVWLCANRLQVNITKTEYMLIGTDHKPSNLDHEPVLILNHNILKRVSKSKILGLIYDEHLRWNDHVNELIEKITQALKMIRRVSSFMSRQNLLLIYHSLVEQRLNYCSEVWDFCLMAYPKNCKNCKTGQPESSQESSQRSLHLVNYLLNLGGVHLLMSEELKKLS